MKTAIISPIGKNSLHQSWLENSSSDFLAICYESVDDELLKDAKIVVHQKGHKYSLIKKLLDDNPGIVDQYDYFMLLDDDIATSSKKIEEIFQIHSDNKLLLSQPALTRDSYFSHRITRRYWRKKVRFRYTNFVEMMCPIFSKESLKKCIHTFDSNKSGWGLDYIWPEILNFEGIAIIDEVCVKHTRKCGSLKRLMKEGINPLEEAAEVKKIFNSSFIKPKNIKLIY